MAVIVIAIITSLAIYYSPVPERKAAKVSFTLKFPRTISLAAEQKAYVDISCSAADAKLVSVSVSSPALEARGDQKDVIRAGTTETMNLVLAAKDVQDDNYLVSVSVQYSDDFGTHRTDLQTVNVIVLPYVEFTDIWWTRTIDQLLGKSTIHQTDSTELNVRVHSKSLAVYTGLKMTAEISHTNVGVSVGPSSQPVESLGPSGTSRSYAFKLESRNAIVGVYQLKLSLYSRTGELATQLSRDFTVTT